MLEHVGGSSRQDRNGRREGGSEGAKSTNSIDGRQLHYNETSKVLSTVDAVELGLWAPEGKKLKNKERKQLRKYGEATVESEFYMKSKKSKIVFDEHG